MITEYDSNMKNGLCSFFAGIIETHKDYISHGELQMGIATDIGVLAPDFMEKWENYLERQASCPDNFILLDMESGKIRGFIIAGTTSDGDKPYGVIFDMGVDLIYRGNGIGKKLLSEAVVRLREKGVSEYYLESGVNNHSAHEFFEHSGFVQVSSVFRMKDI